MAQISTRLFNYIPDQYLLLGGEEYLRPLAHLGDWQRLRIGMLVSLRELNQATLGQAGLFFGLVSGRINTMSTLYCDNAVGVCLTGLPTPGSTRNWTYNANAGYPYFSVTNAPYFYRRYANPIGGATFSQAGQSYATVAYSTYTYSMPVSGVGVRKRRIPLVLDFTKNPATGVLTYTLYWPADMTSATNTGDYHADHVMEGVDQWGTPVVGGQTWTSSGAYTLPYADSTGALDTLSIFWENQVYPLEVYAVCANLLQDLGTINADMAGTPAYPADGGSYDMLIPYSGSLVNVLNVGTGTLTTATGLNTGRGWLGPYAFFGTSNLTAQYGTNSVLQIALAGTSFGADDPFEQYVAGTVYAGTLSAGTNWIGTWSLAGTYANTVAFPAMAVFYGSSIGSDEPFEQYLAGTIYAGTASAGTNWGTNWTLTGTYSNPLIYLTGAGFYGTVFGMDDPFEQYVAGTVTSGTLSAGTNWGGPWIVVGTL